MLNKELLLSADKPKQQIPPFVVVNTNDYIWEVGNVTFYSDEDIWCLTLNDYNQSLQEVYLPERNNQIIYSSIVYPAFVTNSALFGDQYKNLATCFAIQVRTPANFSQDYTIEVQTGGSSIQFGAYQVDSPDGIIYLIGITKLEQTRAPDPSAWYLQVKFVKK